MHNRTLLFGNTFLKHGHHFDYWNQPLNMRMRVCYLHLSRSWTVLSSDTHRKPIMSIISVLLPLWHIYWLARMLLVLNIGNNTH
jgi:hypothetical protein